LLPIRRTGKLNSSSSRDLGGRLQIAQTSRPPAQRGRAGEAVILRLKRRAARIAPGTAPPAERTRPLPDTGHVALAQSLRGKAEAQLADPSDPRTLDLAIACTVAGYDAGSVYLRALQERARSARHGSTVGVMRASRDLAKARAAVEADAGF
jgi:hypothetical protein